jgi:hypothetical protein
MTAIAAVIALSSTPLLAQTTDASAAQSAPVVVAPPAPAAEPAAPAASAQTASPDVATPAPAEASPAPQPAMKTMSTPVEHAPDSGSAPAMTSGAGTTVSARHAVAAPAGAAHVQARTTAALQTPAVSHTAAAARTAAPAAPHAAPPAATPDAATPAPAPAATVTTKRSTTTHDETLPIAIGLGVIAIGGAAFALSRRKRDDDGEELLLDTPVEPAPVVATEPITMAPRVAEPTPVAVAPATVAAAEGPSRLPNGFDLSRFGRHTRAAYLGPTPDNPSHSLKRRLKRASFFDQREREAAAGTMREPVYPESPAAQAATADQVTIRMAPGRKPSNFGYVPQR